MRFSRTTNSLSQKGEGTLRQNFVHERQRSQRMAAQWEKEIDHPMMCGQLNMAQITLICALHLERRNPDVLWRPGHSKLSEWNDRISERASIAATLPPLMQ